MPIHQRPAVIFTFVFNSPGMSLFYPSVVLSNQRVQDQINHVIKQSIHQLMIDQNKYQTGTHVEMTSHFELKTNERGILSLMLTNYTYSHPMAHGMTLAKSLTFDINTGHHYSLKELFKPGSDYVKVLSAQVAAQIKARNLPLLDGFHSISPEQDFYLADKSLVLYFKLYDITPYYVGFPMFPISVYSLDAIIADKGPLAILAADIA